MGISLNNGASYKEPIASISNSAPAPEHRLPDIIKGYEVGKGEYIELDPEELEAVAIESKRTIDIDEFVPRDDIDELTWIAFPPEADQTRNFKISSCYRMVQPARSALIRSAYTCIDDRQSSRYTLK